MIEVLHLTRRFAGKMAVDDLSFHIERGDVVGLLGSNGAGKTTTLRVLACFLPPTSGMVKVAGHNVLTQSMEVRRRVGYLPENAPMYPDMRVDEYLKFRARLKGLAFRRTRARIDEVQQVCGLAGAGRRIIGHLSKGYRQRVGLAECILNDPEILLLDEPALGLDPNQAREMRELITRLAERRTIVLCTHSLSEAERLCRRLLVLHRGRLVAFDTAQNLKRDFGLESQTVAQICAPNGEDIQRLARALPGVKDVHVTGEGEWKTLVVRGAQSADLRSEVYRLASRENWNLKELRLRSEGLEKVFSELTFGAAGEGGGGEAV